MKILDALSARINEISKLPELPNLSPEETYKFRRDRLMQVREAIDDAMINLVDDTIEPTGLNLDYRQRIDMRSRTMEDLCDLLCDADTWADAD